MKDAIGYLRVSTQEQGRSGLSLTEKHPELVGSYLSLHAAELVASRMRDPEDRRKFVELVRSALADSIARGEPLQPVRLRDRPSERAAARAARDRAQAPVRG